MSKSPVPRPTIKVTPEEYQEITQKISPKPRVFKNVVLAFLVGGIICSLGQVLINFYTLNLEMAKTPAQIAATATLIFLGALLTGLGVYDDIVKFGGAGGIVPVTGFANSMVSPALEFKREGYVFGIGARLFTIAGPVLVYGIASSIVVGIINVLLR